MSSQYQNLLLLIFAGKKRISYPMNSKHNDRANCVMSSRICFGFESPRPFF